MLNVKAVAERAGVCRSLVYAWVQAGELPHYRLGQRGKRGAIRVAEADLEAFLASMKKISGPASTLAPNVGKKNKAFLHLKLK